MGGIFGAVCRDRIPRGVIKEGLSRLIYRGYDGAGVAIMRDGGIEIRKAPGHLEKIASSLDLENIDANIALGHTRYASRGWPVYENTHPLTDCAGKIAVVADGIIEDYETLRESLEERGHKFVSRTDTEVISHLLEEEISKKGLDRGIIEVFSQLRGMYAAAFLVHQFRAVGFAVQGQPLVIGFSDSCLYLSSDIPSLYGIAETAYVLEDGLVGLIKDHEVKLYKLPSGVEVSLQQLTAKRVKYVVEPTSKLGFPHYMLKEIYDIPEAVNRLLLAIMEKYLRLASMIVYGAKNVYIIGDGTSLHAGLIGTYYLSELAGIDVVPVSAAEFVYSNIQNVQTGTVVIAISQSGETSDVVASVKAAKQRGAVIVAITNNVGSRLALESNVYLPIGAGPELAVPATKTFVNTVLSLYLLATYTGMYTGKTSESDYKTAVEKIKEMGREIAGKLDEIRHATRSLVEEPFANVYVASSGITYPVALEGALKLKEAALIHAEGIHIGELRHGPIVLVSKDFPIILIEPVEKEARKLFDKVVKELYARNTTPIIVGYGQSGHSRYIAVPYVSKYLYPVSAVVPLQLLAYNMGVKLSRPIDTPPGLAKAITT